VNHQDISSRIVDKTYSFSPYKRILCSFFGVYNIVFPQLNHLFQKRKVRCRRIINPESASANPLKALSKHGFVFAASA
jgi:hypothetical protein